MNSLDKKLGVVFDANNNTLISRERLFEIIQLRSMCTVMFETTIPLQHGYMLIDNEQKEAYILTEDEYGIWERDGSIEPDDSLFKIQFIRKNGLSE